MYVKVRTMDGSQTAVVTISKLTSVKDFRFMVEEKLGIGVDRQRLFYRGKQMEDGYSMFDYNININNVIQLMVKPVLTETNSNTSNKPSSVKKDSSAAVDKENLESNNNKENKAATTRQESEYYRVGDLVDAKFLYDGTWWEGRIVKITDKQKVKQPSAEDDGFLYHVVFEGYDEDSPSEMLLKHIRPRAHMKIEFEDVNPGDVVMVNYNMEDPEERGHWFDCKVNRIINTRTQKELVATVYCGAESTPLENCHIHLVNELFAVEKNIRLDKRTEEIDRLVTEGSPSKSELIPIKCKECGCNECGGKENPEKQLMCDECDMPFHIYCLTPPMESIPDVDEWFCPLCKNDDSEIVKAGEKLKESKKKAKMASSKSNTSRDWGKGFACAGRQKVCTLVPQNHFGPVPGVEVGTLWKFRLQVSEAGIHRPHVAGIHGREHEGAYSIVLSGGYEDDEDNGDSFTYTGSGGRDLSGNKRTAEQSCDQQLTRMNRALALNCNTPVNKNGAEATDWKGGKPVRVVRNAKGRKHSKYAPEEGNRYDGIYKIVKYWQDTGKSGFKVWRYLLRRDDPMPAPWTKEGTKRIHELELEMQYPDGYLEAQKEKEEKANKEDSGSDDEGDGKKKKNKTNKRKNSLDLHTQENGHSESKKRKSTGYVLERDIKLLIGEDKGNTKLWEECKPLLEKGRSQFLSGVEGRFLCVCCQELVIKPVTTMCNHNVCQTCLQRSFKAEVFTCPACRYDLGKGYKMDINKSLSNCLIKLFPGYDVAR
ncbi:E3 ubiquitin-protein ligase UHRF1-like [Homarus americanus]|uniref:RING-type E3 ubiquitin transferase n=1 Tax=Homarus americanus TaxID=6706 RepID=A0A8J5KES2_HOMAM|nr:E3 ubiquitin-protein ligase UHRF1-like [Homarus americanus]